MKKQEKSFGEVIVEQIGSANHDYLQSEFYLTGIKGDTLKWGNPYQDDAGAKSEVMTYALPIRNNLDAFRSGERRPLGNVLITGATGYLGIHILHELIHSDAQNIYCLVRAKSHDIKIGKKYKISHENNGKRTVIQSSF